MKSSCSSPQDDSAAVPSTRMRKMKRTVSQTFPTEVECSWTSSRKFPRRLQSPITAHRPNTHLRHRDWSGRRGSARKEGAREGEKGKSLRGGRGGG